MHMMVGKGQCHEAAKEMAEEYRSVLKEARTALLDRAVEDYEMFSSQMSSLKELVFQDEDGNAVAVKQYLSHDEYYRPFGIEQ